VVAPVVLGLRRDPRVLLGRAVARGRRRGAVVRIAPDHLVPTVMGLARAVALVLGVRDVEAYLALTA